MPRLTHSTYTDNVHALHSTARTDVALDLGIRGGPQVV